MPTCKNCQTEFTITDADRQFYNRIEVPEPTWCPDCRTQRRLAFRNERTLYKRKCDLTGREVISAYSPECPLVVYDQKEWWGDKWDPLEYGREFDFSRGFFPQFAELERQVPHFSLYNMNPVNSEFTNFSLDNKNVYFCFSAVRNEDCFYSVNIDDSRDCFDCLFSQDGSELCYEGVDITRCYNCLFIQSSDHLTDCHFCYDCRGCNNCLGCVSLRSKSYYWFNQQLTKNEYEKRLADLDLGSFKRVEQIKQKFSQHLFTYPRRHAFIIKAIKSTGDYLYSSKNIRNSFDVYGSEDCAYCIRIIDSKDAYDVYGMADGELINECVAVGDGSDIAYSLQSYYNHGIRYCALCFSSRNLFGCVSLRHKNYCILNKQYTEEEYKKLLPRLVGHMKKTGEWGQYFPVQLSPFGYNETLAQENFPLSKEQVLEQGFKWQDQLPDTINRETLKPQDIPDNIKDVDDSIVNEVLACQECGKNYKIINQELKFYRDKNLPLPRKCFACRHLERVKLHNPRKLWDRKCDKCGKDIKTSYAPDRPEKIYCEECYKKEVY